MHHNLQQMLSDVKTKGLLNKYLDQFKLQVDWKIERIDWEDSVQSLIFSCHPLVVKWCCTI